MRERGGDKRGGEEERKVEEKRGGEEMRGGEERREVIIVLGFRGSDEDPRPSMTDHECLLSSSCLGTTHTHTHTHTLSHKRCRYYTQYIHLGKHAHRLSKHTHTHTNMHTDKCIHRKQQK